MDVSKIGDAGWGFFFEILMPDEYDNIGMSVQRTVMALEEAGDSLEKDRLIDFFYSFDKVSSRAEFLKSIDSEFLVKTTKTEDADDSKRYTVHLQRKTNAQARTLGNFLVELLNMAKEHKGEFEDWNCPPRPS